MPTGVSKNPCGAKKTNGAGTCTLNSGYGTTHPGSGRCKFHGGSTEAGKAAAAKQEGARMAKYVDFVEIDPTTALLQELYRTAGHVQFLDRKIADWELDTDKEIPDHQQHWMKVHMVERIHMSKVAKLALDAGVAEREIRLAEQQGMILAGAIEAILERLDLTGAQRSLVPTVVPDILRNLSLNSSAVVVEGGQ